MAIEGATCTFPWEQPEVTFPGTEAGDSCVLAQP